MPIVAMPDGTQVQFPDDMPNEQIKGMIASKFPDVANSAQPSLLQKIDNNLQNTQQEARASGARLANGQQGLPENLAQGLSQAVGMPLGDVAAPILGASVKAAYGELPQGVQQGIGNVANQALQSNVGRSALKGLQNVQQGWNSYEQRDPAGAADLKALGTALSMGVGKKAIDTIGNVAESGIAKDLGSALSQYGTDISTTKTLPSNLQSLAPLAEANTSIFSKTPNPIDFGLTTNQGISKTYDVAKKAVKGAYDMVQNAGDFEVPAPNIYNKLSDITSYLEDKVAPVGKDRAALNQLKTIQNNLENKYGIAATEQKTSNILDASGNPIIKSQATASIPANTVSANDLVQLDKAMSAALPAIGKNLASGDLSLLDFKSEIGKAINDASTIKPEFGEAYQNAKDLYGKMANIFYDPNAKGVKTNPQLAPIWKISDYKNMGKSITPTDTLSRAGKTLSYLDTQDTGKISAVLNALPPEQRQSLMNAALANSKQNKISVGSALIQLVRNPTQPSQAAGTALRMLTTPSGKTPLETAVKTAKGIKK